MCGIAGVVRFERAKPDMETLLAMQDALLHRGPDGEGCLIYENVGLAHTRLAILDPTSAGAQPMTTPDGRWSVVLNGEIFNHRELRDRLPPTVFESNTDTETLLHALLHWGEAALPRLVGQFAFAAIDHQGDRLVLARDPFGIKPLYIAQSDEGLWFASEPGALFAAGIDPSPSPNAWTEIVAGSRYGGDATLHSNLSRLPPGSIAEVSLESGTAHFRTWFQPNHFHQPAVHGGATSRYTRIAATDDLEEVLIAAVGDNLLSDAPVGTLLSGGVDSSLLTALAHNAESDIVAFAGSFDGDDGPSELDAATRAAEAIGVDLELVTVDAEMWRTGFVPATVAFGAPLPNASSVLVAAIAERANSLGRKVLLTGEGADELFGGYQELHDRHFNDWFSSPIQILRLLEPLLIGRHRAVRSALRRRISGDYRKSPWPHLQQSPYRQLDQFVDVRSAPYPSPLREAIEEELLDRMDLTLCHLLTRMDKNAMQSSVETRVPFLDPRVFNYCLHLPLEYRIGPMSKGILRDVARRHLPLRTAYRPKFAGMNFSVERWMERDADPRFLTDGLLPQALGIRSGEVEAFVAASSGSILMRIWSAEIWCRATVGQQTETEINASLWRRDS